MAKVIFTDLNGVFKLVGCAYFSNLDMENNARVLRMNCTRNYFIRLRLNLMKIRTFGATFSLLTSYHEERFTKPSKVQFTILKMMKFMYMEKRHERSKSHRVPELHLTRSVASQLSSNGLEVL